MSDLNNLINKYENLRNRITAFDYANYLISWDTETIAPVGCFDTREKYVGYLVEMQEEIKRSDEYLNLIKELYNNKNNLPEPLNKEIIKVYEELEKSLKIPMEEKVAFSKLLASSQMKWFDAKRNNNFKQVESILDEIISFEKKYIKYLETDSLSGYNVLLNEFEKGMTIKEYDEFFNALKEEIVPLVKQINKLELKTPSWVNQKFDINKQKNFAKYLEEVMCFDNTYGLQSESEHPFTTGFGSTDVRVTNHYYEDLLISSIYSAIHELGHATYERNVDSVFDGTILSGGTTMAMHESQSRFYENIIGRSYEFVKKHYPILQIFFYNELKDVSINDFYKYVNYVECSLIRTEADELTYSLHVLIRYEVEKAIFINNISASDARILWNKLYKEYLGIDVPSDKEGILQDSHWGGGAFGYFPTYALGSAYAAQLYHQMKKELNVDVEFGKDNLEIINNWLKEKVHKFGGSKTPKEILIEATGEEFNVKYYIEYLKDKYTKIYNL